MERWRGRAALVTGASSGTGYAVAEALATHGVNVIGCARRIENIEELAKKCASCGKVTAIKCDLVNEDDIVHMFQRIEKEFGHVDIVVNNAGTFTHDDLLTGDSKGWKQMIDLNVMALSICNREALRLMFKDKIDDGHIINFNSIAGHMNSQTGHNAFDFYIGAKHMVTALTKALNAELRQKKTNIRVTSISGGLVQTEVGGDRGDLEKMRELSPGQIRVLQEKNRFPAQAAKDMADAVLYVVGAPPYVNVRELTLLMSPIG
ncbi:hypothetical protein RvY_16468 [Ramazzottius varieornatus]|uniref:Dehydrogenase/reductase SDR family member 11 n=1 Tax=Ramazzottius varieornatus TaxID=947166 RepID=A0A1D1VZE5_RAMVA|nr:hypothetical protein RvY_16468 [Ramazzottius varieornatus]